MKKVTSALIALSMTVVLSGCLFGKKEEAQVPAETPAASDAPAAPTDTAAPAEGAPAAPAEGQPAHQ